MITQAVGSNSPPTTLSTTPATTKNFSDLGSEDFFGLLIAQLRSQDPLKPTDNQALLEQMSSIREMEQSSALTKSLQSLSFNQRFGDTSSMIGKYVFGSVRDQAGQPHELEGLVMAVRFQKDGRAILDLHNGESLPVEGMEELTHVDNLPAPTRERLLAELGQGTIPAPTSDPLAGTGGIKPAPLGPGAKRPLADPAALFSERPRENSLIKALFS